MASHGFKCACEACIENFPFLLFGALKFIGIPLAQSLSIAEYKKHYDENCKKLAENRQNPADLDMYVLMDLNDVLRAAIGKNEPFIF